MFDIEQSFQAELANLQVPLGQAMKELSDAIKAAQAGGGVLDPKATAAVAEALRGMAGRANQNVGEPARLIAQVVNMLMRADMYTKLALRQRELADLAKRFNEKDQILSRIQQMEMQEMAGEERDIMAGVSSLLDELPDLADKLPQDDQYDKLRATTAKFVQAAKDLKITEGLDAAAGQFAGQNGPEAYAKAKDAAENMAKLLNMTEGGDGIPAQGGNCLAFNPSLQKTLGNTLAQVLAALQSMGMGSGGSGGSGLGMNGNETGLYGPDIELAGSEGGGMNFTGSGPTRPSRPAVAPSDPTSDPGVRRTQGPIHVRVQRDAKFPLRWRQLVGEYMRAVAEGGE
jgi:hypothetical protein